MSYILCLYIVYVLFVTAVIGWAGWQLHQAGKPFVQLVLRSDSQKADGVNGVLLTGYYLVCMGYSFFVLSSLPVVESLPALMAVLFLWLGRLMLVLSLLHYINMLVFSLWNKYQSV